MHAVGSGSSTPGPSHRTDSASRPATRAAASAGREGRRVITPSDSLHASPPMECTVERDRAGAVMLFGMPKPLDWEKLLIDGYEPLRKAQRLFRRLPHDPRCKLCQNPFGGVGGKLVGLIGRRPSRKNPNLCQYCFDHLPTGGLELDIGVVFADVRGSTGLGERSTATEFADRLNRFYATAARVR